MWTSADREVTPGTRRFHGGTGSPNYGRYPTSALLFNALDRDDQVGPDAPLALPRGPHWKFVAQPPRGRMWLVAVLLPDGSPAPQLGASAEFEALRAGLADGQTIRWLGGAGCEQAMPTCAAGLGVQFAALEVR